MLKYVHDDSIHNQRLVKTAAGCMLWINMRRTASCKMFHEIIISKGKPLGLEAHDELLFARRWFLEWADQRAMAKNNIPIAKSNRAGLPR